MTTIFWVIGSIALAWLVLIGGLAVIRPGGLNLREAISFVPECLLLLKRLISTSLRGWHKVVVFAAVVYLLSPVDLVPDFIPVVGIFDDVIVAVAALRYASKSVSRTVIEQNWTGSPNGLALVLRASQ